jgi:PKHD-type hydroxylase
MNYNNIHNNPTDRKKSTYPYVFWDNAFSEEEISQLQNLEKIFSFENSKIFDKSGLNENNNIRRSKVNFFPKNNETGWIFERFNNIIKSINDNFYGFELNGYEKIQFTVYDSEDEGTYDWHMDTFLGKNANETEDTRKLTLILLLNESGIDFVGGDLLMNMGMEKNALSVPLHKGRIVAFPSFLIHKVTPVLRGMRKSLVIWVEGPKFK